MLRARSPALVRVFARIPERQKSTFAVVASTVMVYALAMATVISDALGLRTRPSQEETSPIPLEFMIVSRRARVNQEETAPFPLEFEVVARKARVSQEETSPFPLEFMVVLPDGEVALARAAPVRRRPGKTPPGLKWRGINASVELREYAARIASGEDLPPYRGPILASGEFPGVAPEAPRRAGTGGATAVMKVALGLIVISAALLASAMLGDDAQLRAAGQSISRWFTGANSSVDTSPPVAPASGLVDPR